MRNAKIPLAILLLIAVSGCASFAKGVTQAILEQSEEEDTRACHVEGPASSGFEALLREQENERAGGQSTRVLKVPVRDRSGGHAAEGRDLQGAARRRGPGPDRGAGRDLLHPRLAYGPRPSEEIQRAGALAGRSQISAGPRSGSGSSLVEGSNGAAPV